MENGNVQHISQMEMITVLHRGVLVIDIQTFRLEVRTSVTVIASYGIGKDGIAFRL